MIWPLKEVYITQYWGGNPEMYARFGLKGHNGIDLRASNGTPVYAPHPGTIKERRLDANGYGNYLKIESEIEGSVLGHLKEFAVGINKVVKKGELVGYSDNTGFSTGPHLHWGYYKIPRNRNDGYLGYINQLPLIKEDSMSCLLYNNSEDEKLFSELVSKASKYDEFKKEGYENIGQLKFFMDELRQNVLDANQARRIEAERGDELRKELNELIATLANEDHLHTVQEKTEILAEAKKAGANAKDLEDIKRSYGAFKEEASKVESELKAEIARLKALLKQENVLENTKLEELVKELIKRLVALLPKNK
jgi:hypothetical protein